MAIPKQIIIEDLSPEEREVYIKKRKEKQEKLDSIAKYKKGDKFKYRLTAEGNSHVQSIQSTFKITYLYELVFVDLDKENNLYRFELTELSYSLDKYEDPILAQIVEMSNEVSKIYRHLDFGVNRQGNIQKIYNREEIKKVWEKTKEYLTYKHPLSSFEIIKVKERELNNPQMEIENISFMHFMQVYFKQFGRFGDREVFRARHMDQFGSGIPFDLNIEFSIQEPKDGCNHRIMKGQMIYDAKVERELAKAVKDSSAEIDYNTRADYYSDGMILKEVNYSYDQKIGKNYNMYTFLHLEQIEDAE